jgi:hypothetical protein
VGALELFPPGVATVTSEIALPRRFSLALGTGYGARSIDVNGSNAGTAASFIAMVAPRWYLLGRFEEGLHVGWSFAYARAVSGPLAVDLLPPPGLSSGPTFGYKARFPWHVSLGFDLGLVHDFWIASEAGQNVPWVYFCGDLQVGVTL